MNELQVFGFEGRNVRVVEKDGNPWWVGRDVCEILGYENPSKAMGDHCKGITNRYPLSTGGGIQEVRILSEPDVLRLIVSSKLPEAIRFEAWVFEEVLPSIRNTGSYRIPEDFNLPAATKMREIRMLLKMGIIDKPEARKALFQPTKKPIIRNITKIQTPELPADITLDTLLTAFPGWSEKLLETHCTLERFGMKRVPAKGGVVHLAIHHNHKEITKICGRDYKERMRLDLAYIETRQVHIDREKVSALMFDWKMVRDRKRGE